MVDIYDKKKRSEIMSRISGKETKPEIIVRKYLFSQGFRFRKNVKSLPGSPDIVLPKFKTVIFVNGCFWHGHSCKKGMTMPRKNKEFWEHKIRQTKERDKRNYLELKELGWRTRVVWECELRNPDYTRSRINEIINLLAI